MKKIIYQTSLILMYLVLFFTSCKKIISNNNISKKAPYHELLNAVDSDSDGITDGKEKDLNSSPWHTNSPMEYQLGIDSITLTYKGTKNHKAVQSKSVSLEPLPLKIRSEEQMINLATKNRQIYEEIKNKKESQIKEDQLLQYWQGKQYFNWKIDDSYREALRDLSHPQFPMKGNYAEFYLAGQTLLQKTETDIPASPERLAMENLEVVVHLKNKQFLPWAYVQGIIHVGQQKKPWNSANGDHQKFDFTIDQNFLSEYFQKRPQQIWIELLSWETNNGIGRIELEKLNANCLKVLSYNTTKNYWEPLWMSNTQTLLGFKFTSSKNFKDPDNFENFFLDVLINNQISDEAALKAKLKTHEQILFRYPAVYKNTADQLPFKAIIPYLSSEAANKELVNLPIVSKELLSREGEGDSSTTLPLGPEVVGLKVLYHSQIIFRPFKDVNLSFMNMPELKFLYLNEPMSMENYKASFPIISETLEEGGHLVYELSPYDEKLIGNQDIKYSNPSESSIYLERLMHPNYHREFSIYFPSKRKDGRDFFLNLKPESKLMYAKKERIFVPGELPADHSHRMVVYWKVIPIVRN